MKGRGTKRREGECERRRTEAGWKAETREGKVG